MSGDFVFGTFKVVHPPSFFLTFGEFDNLHVLDVDEVLHFSELFFPVGNDSLQSLVLVPELVDDVEVLLGHHQSRLGRVLALDDPLHIH